MALSLLAKRGTAALRAAAAARAQRPSRVMFVRAFKDDKKHPKEEKEQETTSAVERHRGGGAVSPRHEDTLQVMPFRRMTDAMNQMQREMDAMMSHFGMDLWDPFSTRAPATPFSSLFDMMGPMELPSRTASLSRMLPVEVEESDKAYTVHAEVPGFSKDDIKVTLDPANQLLTISAARKEEEKQEGGGGSKGAKGAKEGAPAYTRRSSMSFTRTFSLPQDADLHGEWDATTAHGVLTLTIPKLPSEAAKAPAVKEIPIKESKA